MAPAIVTFEVRVSRVGSLLLWVACYLQPCPCLTCWHGSCHHTLAFTFTVTQGTERLPCSLFERS